MLLLRNQKAPSLLNDHKMCVGSQPTNSFCSVTALDMISGSEEVAKRPSALCAVGFCGHCPPLARGAPTPNPLSQPVDFKYFMAFGRAWKRNEKRKIMQVALMATTGECILHTR
jgi:hypothetical protein